MSNTLKIEQEYEKLERRADNLQRIGMTLLLLMTIGMIAFTVYYSTVTIPRQNKKAQSWNSGQYINN